MNGEIEKTISEHAVTIGVLVHSFKKIEGFMEKTMESQLKQEVLMERLTNFEETNNNDHKHIHSRIDEIVVSLKAHAPKAVNGQVAYNIFKWGGVTIGALLIGKYVVV